MTSPSRFWQGGRKIVQQAIPDNPIIPFTKATASASTSRRSMIKVTDGPLAAARKIHWMEVMPARSRPACTAPDEWLPRKPFDAPEGVLRSSRADDDPGWRHPLAERGAAPGTRSVPCVRPVSISRRSLAAEAPRNWSTWSSSARTPRTCTPVSREVGLATRGKGRRSCRTRWASRKSASRKASGIGIAGFRRGHSRLVRAAIEYAIDNDRKVGDHRRQGQHDRRNSRKARSDTCYMVGYRISAPN